MQERWAVAFEPCDMGQGKFLWLRDQCGNIIVFGSKREARMWVLVEASFSPEPDDAVYIKLPHGNTG